MLRTLPHRLYVVTAEVMMPVLGSTWATLISTDAWSRAPMMLLVAELCKQNKKENKEKKIQMKKKEERRRRGDEEKEEQEARARMNIEESEYKYR